jgi:hypothetical protein
VGGLGRAHVRVGYRTSLAPAHNKKGGRKAALSARLSTSVVRHDAAQYRARFGRAARPNLYPSMSTGAYTSGKAGRLSPLKFFRSSPTLTRVPGESFRPGPGTFFAFSVSFRSCPALRSARSLISQARRSASTPLREQFPNTARTAKPAYAHSLGPPWTSRPSQEPPAGHSFSAFSNDRRAHRADANSQSHASMPTLRPSPPITSRIPVGTSANLPTSRGIAIRTRYSGR